MKNKIAAFLIPILICFAVGFIAGQLQSDSIENWYPFLEKPSLTPPNIVFPIVWNILYLCMGISIGFILISHHPTRGFLIRLFISQLILNFGWSILFFYMQSPLLGLVDIILLDILLIIYVFTSYPVSKVSSLLFVPYVIWVTFATYLNLYILIHN